MALRIFYLCPAGNVVAYQVLRNPQQRNAAASAAGPAQQQLTQGQLQQNKYIKNQDMRRANGPGTVDTGRGSFSRRQQGWGGEPLANMDSPVSSMVSAQ